MSLSEPKDPDAHSGSEPCNHDERTSYRLAGLLTFGYLAVVGALTVLYAEFPTALSDWGDFLAGAFAPLAFGWLVYGYYLQREELRLQRRELKATSEANRDQAKHLLAQVDLAARSFDAEEKRQAQLVRRARAGQVPRLSLQVRDWEPNLVTLRLRNDGATAFRTRLRSCQRDWHPAPPGFEETVDLDLDETHDYDFTPPNNHEAFEFMVSFQCELENGKLQETTFYASHDYNVRNAGTKIVSL